jgi:hypothetical protein
MFCQKCGKEIKEGAKFCPSCGAASDGSDLSGGAKPKSGKKKILKAVKITCLVAAIGLAAVIGLMVLTARSGYAGAHVTSLVNDLRNFKSAALLYYGDYNKWPDAGGPLGDKLAGELARYSYGSSYQYPRGIYITPPSEDADGALRQYIGVNLERVVDPKNRFGSSYSFGKLLKEIKKKLAGSAREIGLFQASGAEIAPYRDAPVVYMNMR